MVVCILWFTQCLWILVRQHPGDTTNYRHGTKIFVFGRSWPQLSRLFMQFCPVEVEREKYPGAPALVYVCMLMYTALCMLVCMVLCIAVRGRWYEFILRFTSTCATEPHLWHKYHRTLAIAIRIVRQESSRRRCGCMALAQILLLSTLLLHCLDHPAGTPQGTGPPASRRVIFLNAHDGGTFKLGPRVTMLGRE